MSTSSAIWTPSLRVTHQCKPYISPAESAHQNSVTPASTEDGSDCNYCAGHPPSRSQNGLGKVRAMKMFTLVFDRITASLKMFRKHLRILVGSAPAPTVPLVAATTQKAQNIQDIKIHPSTPVVNWYPRSIKA